MLCRGSSGFLIVDLTFHGQKHHLLKIQRQLPCSDGFACLRSHPSLVNRRGCARYLTHLSPNLYTKGGCARIYKFGTAASYHGLKVVLSKEFAEHENEAVKL